MRHKTVLFSPLDWGLGHTTRCIPLMRHMQLRGAKLLFAGTDAQTRFVRQAFPHIEFLPLKGYGVRYARSAGGFLPRLLFQVPGILQTIQQEHRWLLSLCREHNIHGVVSDNRYGLWHPQIPSVILTHQLRVQTGMGAMADSMFQRLHYTALNRFGACWVPDVAAPPGLSGTLGHPPASGSYGINSLPRHTSYIGPLSQFAGGGSSGGGKNPVVLLSGPEPQRTLLSDLLWQQVCDLNINAVFIEGRADVPPRTAPTGVTWMAQLGGSPLRTTLLQASYVIGRCGYSTVMDAATLGLRIIAVPTPGQTEQEYLARELAAGGHLLHFRQRDFQLHRALALADKHAWQQLPATAPGAFEPVLDRWLEQL